MYFSGSKMGVARFVVDLLQRLGNDSVQITIISQAKYAGCSVRIVIDTSLESIVLARATNYSLRRINT